MDKSPDAFRTISEVADWLGVPAHVLRFWESKFTQVKPVKRAGGRRYYRPADMALLGGIKTLLHDDGMTIKGVQKVLREKGTSHVAGFSPDLDAEPAVPGRKKRPPETDADEIEDALLAEDVPEATPQPSENVVPFQARDEAKDETGDGAEAPAKSARKASSAAEDGRKASSAAEDGRKASSAAEDGRKGSDPRQPALPSFLTQPPDRTATGAAKPRIVDAPDPEPDDRIAVAAGALSHVGRLNRCEPATAKALAPLLGRLAVLRDRMSGARG